MITQNNNGKRYPWSGLSGPGGGSRPGAGLAGLLLLVTGLAGFAGVVSAQVEEAGQPDDSTDVDQVDDLSLPGAAAPVASESSPQTTAPVGKYTGENIGPAQGVRVNANLGFFPSLTISVTRRDNPARIKGGEDQDDIYWNIAPVLRYRGAVRNRHVYELAASASRESFGEFENLDNDSLNVSAALRLDMTEKLKVDLYGNRFRTSDPRGSTATRVLPADLENDEYDELAYGGRITLGRRSNPLQLVLGAQQSDLEFTNNDQQPRNRQDRRLNGGIYLNLSPRTSVFLLGAMTDIDYEADSSEAFDSTNTNLNIGLGWEPSYSTSLLLQAGWIEKGFDDSALDDQDSNSYLGKLTWLPGAYTSLNLYASRAFEETTLRSSPVTVSDLLGISLDHVFTASIRGQAYYNLIEDELVDARQDEITDYGIGLFYEFNRYLSLGLSWDHTERTSTDPEAEYETEAYTLTATLKPRRVSEFGEPEIQTGEGLGGVE